MSIDSARGALVQVCDEHSYIMESDVVKQIKDQVEAAAGNDGKVDQKEFEMVFARPSRKRCRGRKTTAKSRR